MKLVAAVAAAVVLGVVIMFMPIMAYTQLFVTTRAIYGTSQEANCTVENQDAFCIAQPDGEEGRGLKSATLEVLDEAAQVYGVIDVGPTPFPSSLLHVVQVVATGLAAAIAASLYVRRKARLA